MENQKLKVGIAGYGVVGKRRRKVIDKHASLEVVAVCDISFNGVGTLEDGTRYHPDSESLLLEELDILFVCLPNYLASEVTIAGLDAGLHVFCEKPPGRDVADIAKVVECEKRHPNLRLKYGFNHRYHDSIKEALTIVQSGELGTVINLNGVYGKSKIISFDSDWRTQRKFAGGGILLDQGIHMVDMMRIFAGEFEDVHSIISNSFWKHDVEDNAYALMKTKNGVVAMLHSSATHWRHRFRLEISLSKGQIILEGILSGSKSYGAEKMTVVYVGEEDEGDPFERTTRYNNDPSWKAEIDEFAEAVLEGSPVLSGSSRDALLTVQLVYRIYCSDPQWRDRYGLTYEVPDALT